MIREQERPRYSTKKCTGARTTTLDEMACTPRSPPTVGPRGASAQAPPDVSCRELSFQERLGTPPVRRSSQQDAGLGLGLCREKSKSSVTRVREGRGLPPEGHSRQQEGEGGLPPRPAGTASGGEHAHAPDSRAWCHGVHATTGERRRILPLGITHRLET